MPGPFPSGAVSFVPRGGRAERFKDWRRPRHLAPIPSPPSFLLPAPISSPLLDPRSAVRPSPTLAIPLFCPRPLPLALPSPPDLLLLLFVFVIVVVVLLLLLAPMLARCCSVNPIWHAWLRAGSAGCRARGMPCPGAGTIRHCVWRARYVLKHTIKLSNVRFRGPPPRRMVAPARPSASSPRTSKPPTWPRWGLLRKPQSNRRRAPGGPQEGPKARPQRARGRTPRLPPASPQEDLAIAKQKHIHLTMGMFAGPPSHLRGPREAWRSS